MNFGGKTHRNWLLACGKLSVGLILVFAACLCLFLTLTLAFFMIVDVVAGLAAILPFLVVALALYVAVNWTIDAGLWFVQLTKSLFRSEENGTYLESHADVRTNTVDHPR
jgi:hypothetical protein